jgi:signal recognition particle subunit SRP68
LELYLFEAERLYAFSQELFENKRIHKAIAKLRRCQLWADRLADICQKMNLSGPQYCEVLAYQHIVHGHLFLKRDRFESSITHLALAYYLLEKLWSGCNSSRDKALMSLYMDEVAPEIRYSAHHLKLPRTHEVEYLVKVQVQKYGESVIHDFTSIADHLSSVCVASQQPATLQPLTWNDSQIDVRIPELVDRLLAVQSAEDKSIKGTNEIGKHAFKARLAFYDLLLQAWTDAEDTARRLVENIQASDLRGLAPHVAKML